MSGHGAGSSSGSSSHGGTAQYSAVRIKGQGLDDEVAASNQTIRDTIKSMAAALDMHPNLQARSSRHTRARPPSSSRRFFPDGKL